MRCVHKTLPPPTHAFSSDRFLQSYSTCSVIPTVCGSHDLCCCILRMIAFRTKSPVSKYFKRFHLDINDSSGIEFFYSSIARTHEAGILQVGHSVSRTMVIPPGTSNYDIFGDCNAQCTTNVSIHFICVIVSILSTI